MANETHIVAGFSPRSNLPRFLKPSPLRILTVTAHRCIWPPAFEDPKAARNGWGSGYEPDGENGIENHATERRCRHEWPNGVAPNVVCDIPTGMHQPGKADE